MYSKAKAVLFRPVPRPGWGGLGWGGLGGAAQGFGSCALVRRPGRHAPSWNRVCGLSFGGPFLRGVCSTKCGARCGARGYRTVGAVLRKGQVPADTAVPMVQYKGTVTRASAGLCFCFFLVVGRQAAYCTVGTVHTLQYSTVQYQRYSTRGNEKGGAQRGLSKATPRGESSAKGSAAGQGLGTVRARQGNVRCGWYGNSTVRVRSVPFYR